MVNPSIVKWQNKTVICYRTSSTAESVTIRTLDDPPNDKTNSSLIFHANKTCSTNENSASWHFHGAGVRMIPRDDGTGRLHLSFDIHSNFMVRMFSSHAHVLPRHVTSSGSQVSFEQFVWFGILTTGYPRHWGRYQKSWVPFVDKKRLLFIQNFNPLHVVEFVEEGGPPVLGESGCGIPSNETLFANSTYKAQVRTVSEASAADTNIDLSWWERDWGALRGGTPGVAIPSAVAGEGLFLAIFHTKHKFNGRKSDTHTYFMGAVTWRRAYTKDANTVYEIYSVSRSPITNSSPHTSLYLGDDVLPAKVAQHFDYCVFPMGIILSQDHKTITVSLGYQDKLGLIMELELHALLESMRCVRKDGSCG
jgi:hypothetical protein